MVKHNTADIYFYSYNIYVENLMPGQDFVYRTEKVGWMLNFVLDGMVEINGIALSEGSWRLSYNEVGDRTIRTAGESKSEILLLFLHKNPYADSHFDRTNQHGVFNTSQAYPIFKIISCLKNPVRHMDINIWITGYIRLLIALLKHTTPKKRSFRYQELKKIYNVVTEMENVVNDFPQPAELVRRTGMRKSRFQNACLALYGQSAQKIIHHLKMNRAFDAIVVDRETITTASTSLGYRHSPNFITAFHDHFAVTPMEVLQTM
jgi:AraC-like DNA-binding protein